MLIVYHAPRTRSVRVLWLLEELGLAYDLRTVAFKPPREGFFSQDTPLGKLPVIEDDGVAICESGAIVEYILERYGGDRLAPTIGATARGRFHQWNHYAESTLYPPIGSLIWHHFYRADAASIPEVVADLQGRAGSAMGFVEQQFGGGPYLLGEEFSAADIMMGFTLNTARFAGVLDDTYPTLNAYLSRLEERPAYQRASAEGT